MLHNRYNVVLISIIFIGTLLFVWSVLYFDALVLHPQNIELSFFSSRFYLPALIVAIVVNGIWLLFLRMRVIAPLRTLIKFTERLAEYDTDLNKYGPLISSEFPKLSHAIDELTRRMQNDQESFRRMELVRSQFLGNVSHELRTPIFALQGFIETLLDGAIDDPEVNRKFLERAFHQTKRLNDLLTDLVEISRIESGDMKLSLRYFNIHEFLEQFVSDMQGVAQQTDIELSYANSGHLGDALVLGDKQRIKQVMENLVGNAIKYNVDDGTVTVRLDMKKKSAYISIIDTGIGIAKEHHDRVFERFYRVDKDRSREIGGTGLGLAIVKHIMQAHNGSVEVSETPGGGSTFTLTLHREQRF